MTNETKARIALVLYAVLVMMVIYMAIYAIAGYRLGLRKPKFKNGDCISLNREFRTEPYTIVVIQVGKEDYLTALVSDGRKEPGSFDSEDIERTDRLYTKIKCNSLIEGIFR